MPGRAKHAKNRKYTAYVVPHTHWDRAWYLPFEEFRIRLVETVDKLLEILRANARFKAFSFDGQTVVLEDYLQIRPEKEKQLRKYVADGRLAIGPWYVLPDEFLASGEALVRNLLLGHKTASKFGPVMKVGYIPDPFGHISQMPQILRGFGIDSMIFSRGSGRNVRRAGLVFKWAAPDERSWVYAVLQLGMYVNLGNWGVPDGKPMDTPDVDYGLALRQVVNLIDRMEQWHNPTRILLFNNGWDHALAQPKVPEMIDYVNRNQDRAKLVQGTFEDFIEALRKDVRPLGSVAGELHEGMEVPLLSGIFSTRMYIKQANNAAQTLLEKVSEPLATFASVLEDDYPAALLLHAWKELLRCHPHDDIGGCSVDSVHDDDMDRLRRVEQVGTTIARRALEGIARRVSCPTGKAIVVYNPLSFSNSAEVSLTIPGKRHDLPANARVLDPQGREAPAVIEWSGFEENLPLEKRSDIGEMRVAFLAEDVPACGYRVYALAPREGDSTEPGSGLPGEQAAVKDARVAAGDKQDGIENKFFSVTANSDGTVNVSDKETGTTYEGLNFFEDVEDAGDEYDFSPLRPPSSLRITSQGKRVNLRIVRDSPYKQSIEVSLSLPVPCALLRDRTARSPRTVSLPIRSVVTLYRGIRRIDFQTSIENRARDHRLRAAFPPGIRTAFAHAESKFDVVKRPLRFPGYTEKYHQFPVPTQHVESSVDVYDAKRGFALLNRGLPEYEAREGESGVTLYQTLFRSVGWLSRPDLLTRKTGNAGPMVPTPGAQMLGTWTFHYSVVPHRGSWEDAKLWRDAQSFACPMTAHLCETSGGDLPGELSFLSVEPETLVISAIKRSESGEGIIVRFYNPTTKKVQARVRFFRQLATAYSVRLDETRLRTLKVIRGDSLAIRLRGKEILTLELQPAK